MQVSGADSINLLCPTYHWLCSLRLLIAVYSPHCHNREPEMDKDLNPCRLHSSVFKTHESAILAEFNHLDRLKSFGLLSMGVTYRLNLTWLIDK